MNLSALGQKALGTSKLYFKRNGPAILTGAGVIGFVGTTVLVAKASVKAKPKVDEVKHNLNAVETREIDADYPKSRQVTEYGSLIIDAGKDLTKIYAPAIVLGAVSIACVISAHGMLKKQNAALVAAYGVLDLGFRTYRERVAEEFGADKERDIYRGVVSRETVTDEEGNSCEIEHFGTNTPSMYGRYFDACSTEWKKTPDWNVTFLNSQQRYANDKLEVQGHLFLNDVYKMLGFEPTKPGQIVGWMKKSTDGKKIDGYVDFGIHNIASEAHRAFVNGDELVVFLDFNVDGPIINYLD